MIFDRNIYLSNSRHLQRMTKEKLNIAIIDDHLLFAESLQRLMLKYDFIDTIDIFTGVDEYLNFSFSRNPDVVMSDILMKGKSGFDFLNYIKKEGLSLKVIFLTSITEVQTIRHAIRSGVNGYVSKEASADELADAILTVYGGETYIGDSLRNSLIRNSLTEDKFVFNLSPREKEVLQHVCSGKTIKETAYDMNLSTNTVQTYYKTILKKFNLNRTADLIVFAIQNGLYNPQDKL